MNTNTTLFAIIGVLILGAGAYLIFADQPTTESSVTNQMTVTSGENPQQGSIVHDLPVEPAAAVARKDLASKLSVEEKSIVIMQITETTWTDGCLGLGGPAESCLQALVPGFTVEMLAKGETYIYRTNKAGTSIRLETK
ncbi:MAG: hypothetical protein G01um10148_1034 [Parcubacteria group bacterium Gr01-1014_8]|nr:MAG: hypothetical protein G01um10148_1034 [Parcubacteria group bacterium Gr01-1014_8]